MNLNSSKVSENKKEWTFSFDMVIYKIPLYILSKARTVILVFDTGKFRAY